MKKKQTVRQPVLAALCLAMCIVLPVAFGSVPVVNRRMLPMHIGVFICAYAVNRKWAAAVGFIAPLLKSLLTGTPVFFPTALAMALELATYGFVCGLLNEKLPKRNGYIYVSLIAAMLAGRVVSGLANMALLGFAGKPYSWEAFVTANLVNAWPGIVIHIILIPAVVMALRAAKLIDREEE